MQEVAGAVRIPVAGLAAPIEADGMHSKRRREAGRSYPRNSLPGICAPLTCRESWKTVV